VPDLAQAIGYHRAGKFEEAERIAKGILQIDPGNVDVSHFLGDVAISYAERAEKLSQIGRYEEAIASYRQSLELAPGIVKAHNDCGNAFTMMERFDEAITCYQRAIELLPTYLPAHYNLASALHWGQGNCAEGIKSYRQALELMPDSARARMGYCMGQVPVVYEATDDVFASRKRYEKALGELEARLVLDSSERIAEAAEAVGIAQPFYLAYQGLNDRSLQARYGAIACSVMDAWSKCQNSAGGRSAKRDLGRPRIRVGMVSGQFRRHSVWDMIARGFAANLDRSRFEVFAYDMVPINDSSAVYADGRFDKVVRGPRSHMQWFDLISLDGPDVLIYPEVGMDISTTRLAATRIAPLQLAAWGHPVTTGLSTIDYFLSGELLEPPGAEAHYVEQLVLLPNLGSCFVPAHWVPANNVLESLDITEY
jgi:protein O-GlcNAc transferase